MHRIFWLMQLRELLTWFFPHLFLVVRAILLSAMLSALLIIRKIAKPIALTTTMIVFIDGWTLLNSRRRCDEQSFFSVPLHF